ncbi:MAG: PA14 domain-containing protein, partial [Segetibacter sp.]
RKRNQMQVIRFGDTVGVRYDIKSGKDNFEIYNVAEDPQEIKNLANEPGMEVVQNKMKERVLQVRMPDTSAPRPYDNDLVPAVSIRKTEGGIRWKAYTSNFPWLPDAATLATSESGLAAKPDVSVSKRTNNGVLLFEGYLKIPADGQYTFTIKAGAGALLRIHDATVIDADFGYVALSEKSGTIRLQAGLHPFRLYSLKTGTTPLLNLEWEGPGINKQKIAANVFYKNLRGTGKTL